MNNELEIWKDIPGYEGLYQISSFGIVKSLSNKFTRKEKILKYGLSRGYPTLVLCRHGIKKPYMIHRLMAMAFFNHSFNGYCAVIDHIDNNRTNNYLSNLQIITQRENSSKNRKNGTSKYVGVSWYKPGKKWRSYITINNKIKHLGYFDCEIEALNKYQNELKLINKN